MESENRQARAEKRRDAAGERDYRPDASIIDVLAIMGISVVAGLLWPLLLVVVLVLGAWEILVLLAK